MKAVVLAAGEGSRLRPLTNRRPKTMLPVANRPLLEHVITALAEAGITEIILVVGYRRARIQSYFGNGDDWNVDITYVTQDQQLGTGHALLQAESHVGEDFIALNGDRIIDPELIERVIERRTETDDPVIAITESDQPSRYGVVEVDGTAVTDIQEQPPEPLAKSNLINAGVYAFGPDIFAALRQTEYRSELQLTDTLQNLLTDHTIRAVPFRGLWLDVSYPWDLLMVNESILDYKGYERPTSVAVDETAVVSETTAFAESAIVHANSTILRGTTLGENVSVGPNAIVEDTIVFSDVTIKGGVILKDCIVGSDTVIGPGTVVEGGQADVAIDDTVHRGVKFGAMIGDGVEVGANVTLQPGTILGNEVTIRSGATVGERIDDGVVITQG